ncbi:hypothetical protein MHIR_DE00603 [Candidatus Doolittlea endobia]|uniref:Uncharacterized protein n=1 Tax=Candidatus Doolittlea endobia TaxID=1778262 RepID=A0A143WT26_9ENTR|nr:hypothetical protein MHIR_DE00603 [Candidatus Doolittlea endobia]
MSLREAGPHLNSAHINRIRIFRKELAVKWKSAIFIAQLRLSSRYYASIRLTSIHL